jgi:hypothetical protein
MLNQMVQPIVLSWQTGVLQGPFAQQTSMVSLSLLRWTFDLH